jgi:hypothetical protein
MRWRYPTVAEVNYLRRKGTVLASERVLSVL